MLHYIFNPSYEMALGEGATKRYSPPKAVCEFERDLSLLPAWYAEEGSAVVSGQENASMPACFPKGVGVVRGDGLRVSGIGELDAWGYCYEVCARFGVTMDKRMFEAAREASARSVTVALAEGLREKGMAHFEMPRLCENAEQIAEAVEALGGGRASGCVFKKSWTSSGRGVLMPTEEWTVEDVVRRFAVRKGKFDPVMAERRYAKVMDFALEFYCGEEIRFGGVSLFNTSSAGNYGGNALARQERLWDRLCEAAGREEVEFLCDAVPEIMERYFDRLADKYGIERGWHRVLIPRFGVDMIVYEDGRERRVYPCVEVNQRMTMGMVAKELSERYLAKDVEGSFCIRVFADNGALRKFDEENEEKNPLVRDGEGRVVRGYMRLTGIEDGTKFIAFVLV